MGTMVNFKGVHYPKSVILFAVFFMCATLCPIATSKK